VRRVMGRDDVGNVNNVHYKSNRNCDYKSPLYNEYFLIKIYFKKEHFIYFLKISSNKYCKSIHVSPYLFIFVYLVKNIDRQKVDVKHILNK
jgi:hypothetical protein